MRSVLKYPGSKWRIAQQIVAQIPQHHSYVEPYFGSGAVFFHKKPSNIETINDLDDDVVNLFRIIRENPKPLIKAIELTPFSRTEYEEAYSQEPDTDSIERARKFLIRCWQGHGFRTTGEIVGWKNDVQGREAAYAVRHWYHLPQWISVVVERLREVQIEHRPALEVIKRFNNEKVFIYADPPYVLSTRCRKNYNHEMTDNDHIELLQALIQHKGTAIISGYECDMYNDLLRGWGKMHFQTLDQLSQKRIETIWIKR